MNFSRWNPEHDDAADAADAADAIDDSEMPPRQYTLIHWGARLSDEDTRVLIDALEAMDD